MKPGTLVKYESTGEWFVAMITSTPSNNNNYEAVIIDAKGKWELGTLIHYKRGRQALIHRLHLSVKEYFNAPKPKTFSVKDEADSFFMEAMIEEIQNDYYDESDYPYWP